MMVSEFLKGTWGLKGLGFRVMSEFLEGTWAFRV